MNYKILSNLPKSHKWKTVSVAGQIFRGIIWDDKDVKQNDVVFLYKKWASIHFDSDWYEIEVNSDADDKATLRDISIVKSLLGNKLNSQTSLIDVNCGAARHLIKLAEENMFGVGMEGAFLLRKMGEKKAKKYKLPLKIVSTSKYFRHKYFESAEIVTSLFNSMGYTFSMGDDIRRLQWMVSLLKPKGYFLLDIRAEEYQRKRFSHPKTITERTYLPTDPNKTPIVITTRKSWKAGILTAEVKITVDNIETKNKIIAQNTSYGWKTYSLKELKSILKKVGLHLIEHKLDYYSSPNDLGERIFLLSQKTE